MKEQFLGLIKEISYQEAYNKATNGKQLSIRLNRGCGLVTTKINSETHYDEVIADYINEEGSPMEYDAFVCYDAVETSKPTENKITPKDIWESIGNQTHPIQISGSNQLIKRLQNCIAKQD